MADATKISELPSAGGLNGDEYIPVVKDGETKKCTPKEITELITLPVLYKTGTTEGTTTRIASNDDAWKYIRFTNTLAKTYTFRETAALTAGIEFTVKNASINSELTIEGDGVTINVLDGKSPIVPIGGTVQVRIISSVQVDIWGDLKDKEV
jgi:hypothetical protein